MCARNVLSVIDIVDCMCVCRYCVSGAVAHVSYASRVCVCVCARVCVCCFYSTVDDCPPSQKVSDISTIPSTDLNAFISLSVMIYRLFSRDLTLDD